MPEVALLGQAGFAPPSCEQRSASLAQQNFVLVLFHFLYLSERNNIFLIQMDVSATTQTHVRIAATVDLQERELMQAALRCPMQLKEQLFQRFFDVLCNEIRLVHQSRLRHRPRSARPLRRRLVVMNSALRQIVRNCSGLTHVSAETNMPRMVDVGGKPKTARTAIARTLVVLPPVVLAALKGPPGSMDLQSKKVCIASPTVVHVQALMCLCFRAPCLPLPLLLARWP